jgi:hypothetical protein
VSIEAPSDHERYLDSEYAIPSQRATEEPIEEPPVEIFNRMQLYDEFLAYDGDQSLALEHVDSAHVSALSESVRAFIRETVTLRKKADTEEGKGETAQEAHAARAPKTPLVHEGQVKKALGYYFSEIYTEDEASSARLSREHEYLERFTAIAHEKAGIFPEIQKAMQLRALFVEHEQFVAARATTILIASYGKRFEKMNNYDQKGLAEQELRRNIGRAGVRHARGIGDYNVADYQ